MNPTLGRNTEIHKDDSKTTWMRPVGLRDELVVDPLMAKDFPGWGSRVMKVFRSDFVPLAKLAAIPAGLTAAYLWAISLAYLGPEKIRERVEAASAAAGQQISNDAAVGMVLARYLPIMAVFGLLLLLAIPLVQSAGLFTVIRRANREFAPVDAAVRFALPRMARLIGWSLLAGLLIVPVVMVALLPGIVGQSRQLFTAGTAVGGVLAVAIGGSLLSALLGVVLVEGKGLKRCFALLRGRWLATGLRMLVFGAIYWAYQQVSEWLLAGVVELVGTGLIPALVMGLLTIPALVAQIVVAVVTYAELRGREDGTGTAGLAAELVGRGSPVGSAGAVSFGGPAATAISVAPRRRWAGFRWVTPVLVLAVLLSAAGPLWSGAGSSVVPVAAVSPVPMAAEDGTGGGDSDSGSEGDAGSGVSASGSKESGSDSGNGGGDKAPEPAAKADSKPSGDDSSGDSGKVAAPSVRTPDAAGSDSGSTGGSEVQQVAGSGVAKGAQQGSQIGASPSAVGAEPGAGQADSAVAGSGVARGAQQGAQQGAQVGVTAATTPGAVPENAAVAAGAPGVKPVGPAETAADTEGKMICTPNTCLIVPSRSASEAAAREAADPNAAKTAPPTGMEGVHTALDMVGMHPAHWSGYAADGVNAAAYALEGDWGNAGISVGSMLPWGDASKAARAARSAEALKALRAEQAAKMTPELRKNLDNRLDQLAQEGKVVDRTPSAAQTPTTADLGTADRDKLAQSDSAVAPSGPARPDVTPGAFPPRGEPGALPDPAVDPGKALRPVGKSLESVDDIYANPQLLSGKTPAQVESILKGTPGWRAETLGRGRKKGQGWVFRQYTDRGHETGPHLRWHPGGGHHGPDPYWRVVGRHGDIGGEIQ